MHTPLAKFIHLAAAAIPDWQTNMQEFKGPLPSPCDDRHHAVCAAFRALSAKDRCEAERQLSPESRSWLYDGADRMAMLSVRLRSRSHLDDALLAVFLNYPAPTAEPAETHGYMGALSICWRCVQLLRLDAAAFTEPLRYLCDERVHAGVEAFLEWKPEDKRPQRWGFHEEVGDHGIIFRWGRLPVPEAWL